MQRRTGRRLIFKNLYMTRFILQKSETQPLGWVLTDTENQIVCQFDEGKFNETQKFTPLREDFEYDNKALPRIVREMSEWLRQHHYEIIFSSPTAIAEDARRDIGQQLREARESRGLDIGELSFLTGLAKNTIKRIEEGRFRIDIDTLAQLCNALNVEIILE